IDKKLDGIPVPSVRTDNKQAIESLVKYLWEQGCKKISFATSEIIGTSSLLDRRNGFYEAAQEFALETLPDCSLTFDEIVYDHQVSEANIEVAMKYLTEHKGMLDGIVCAEYSLVPALMEASRRIGAGVGEDIKLCCVDGPSGLSITHMKQNEIDIADKVVALLLAQINGRKTETDIMVPAIMVSGQKQ
ncbi:MAG TPA: LacI family transcriptional regulator, partial [Clostridiales bacterium]|nr:LacI family transcriptional regulator [Clostridiales bacterium]